MNNTGISTHVNTMESNISSQVISAHRYHRPPSVCSEWERDTSSAPPCLSCRNTRKNRGKKLIGLRSDYAGEKNISKPSSLAYISMAYPFSWVEYECMYKIKAQVAVVMKTLKGQL